MDTPLVSVHIITYNQDRYIAQAIEGALGQQTDFAFEIIIGEDCSTDGTRDAVFEYQKKYPEMIRVITSEQNVGAAANSLRVREACRGKYTAICDGDDYWTDPSKLQKQVAFLEAHPEYSICCHDVDIVNDGVPKDDHKYVDFSANTFSFDDAVRGHFIPTLSVVCRRELLDALPEWVSECVSGDIPMELLMLDAGLGYYIHETMGVKRDNPGGVTYIAERKKRATYSFLRMYKRLNVHTEGRHRSVLHWKIADLSLIMAKTNLRAKRPVQCLRYLSESLIYDKTVVRDCRTARRIAETLSWRTRIESTAASKKVM